MQYPVDLLPGWVFIMLIYTVKGHRRCLRKEKVIKRGNIGVVSNVGVGQLEGALSGVILEDYVRYAGVCVYGTEGEKIRGTGVEVVDRTFTETEQTGVGSVNPRLALRENDRLCFSV